MDERVHWLGFHLIPGIGAAAIARLIEAFGSLSAAWEADLAAFRDAGVNQKSASRLIEQRDQIDLEREWNRVQTAGVTLLTLAEDSYPALLREIPNPPPVLYIKGEILQEDETAIGVVGTRRMTRYGSEMARRLSAGLAAAGMTIVSGLARGIDGIAHREAVDAGGRTLAVLGCGVDRIYPAEHRRLSEEVIENGALISQFPLGTSPDAHNFPERNRLISGMSLGVLVVEAPMKSGALITSSYAADQGRTVFAVPGSALSSSSDGPHQLIRDGAVLAATVDDVLQELNLERRQAVMENRRMLPDATGEEQEILQALDGDPRHIDDIAIDTGINISQLSAMLLQMQLKGMVREVGGQHYARE
jgi:DNA processing protein